MKAVFFNSFKERLLSGKVPGTFYVNCYPVKENFFGDTFNSDDYKVENFRTMDELNKKEFIDAQFGYKQKSVYAEYCCEYVTTPNFQYNERTIDGVGTYDVLSSQLYSYQSAQMCYRFTDFPGGEEYKTPSASIAYGQVVYNDTNSKFLVHFFNHESSEYDFNFGNGIVNDGTTIFMGFVPSKQDLVNGLCRKGNYTGIYPIYGEDFRGLVFADTSGNLIQYVDFEQKRDFYGGCFVYHYPEVYTINNDGNSMNWATFASLE